MISPAIIIFSGCSPTRDMLKESLVQKCHRNLVDDIDDIDIKEHIYRCKHGNISSTIRQTAPVAFLCSDQVPSTRLIFQSIDKELLEGIRTTRTIEFSAIRSLRLTMHPKRTIYF